MSIVFLNRRLEIEDFSQIEHLKWIKVEMEMFNIKCEWIKKMRTLMDFNDVCQ